MNKTYQKKGNLHIENSADNQDAVLEAENKFAKIIVIADGVSSCKNSKRGAELACKAVSDIMLNETEYMFACAKEKIAGLLTAYIFNMLLTEAKTNNETVESYSSTLSFVCYSKISREVMIFVLGDSLVYSIKNGDMMLACNPLISENSTTYTTTTKGVADVVEINITAPSENSEYILATDGAWKTFYSNGTLSETLQYAVKENNIIGYLENQKCKDDCSIVMMDILKGA